MTVTFLKFRRSFGLEANSEVSTDRNSAGICNLDSEHSCTHPTFRIRSTRQSLQSAMDDIQWIISESKNNIDCFQRCLSQLSTCLMIMTLQLPHPAAALGSFSRIATDDDTNTLSLPTNVRL
jgi:hypothetical protein